MPYICKNKAIHLSGSSPREDAPRRFAAFSAARRLKPSAPEEPVQTQRALSTYMVECRVSI